MIGPFIKGFANTFAHMFRKPNTVNYPDQKVPVFPRYRGKQVLMRDEDGLENAWRAGCARSRARPMRSISKRRKTTAR